LSGLTQTKVQMYDDYRIR